MARRGFSLVEMLVVLAITALVLSLLATAYVMELRGIRSAKGLLEMDNDLRAAEQQIRFLLRQRHFESDLRVSEIDPNDPNRQPKAGFFAVIEGGPERLPPGVTSQPEIYVKDGLNFTVRLVGNSPTDFFETSLVQPPNWTASRQSGFNFAGLQPPTWLQLNGGYPESRYQPLATSPTGNYSNVFRSQWAEIAIFLSRQPDPDDPTKRAATVPIDHPAHPDYSPSPSNPPAARLYRLHLRKLLLLPSHFAKGQQNFDVTPAIVVHTLQPPQPWGNDPWGRPNPIYYPDAFDLSVRRETPPGQPYEEWLVNTPVDVMNSSNRFYNPSLFRAGRPWEPNEYADNPTTPTKYEGDWPPGWPGPLSYYSGRQGEDVILQNVVSFDVKLILIQGGSVNVNDGGYDSTSNQPLQGIWIRIRIFNPKTQQMRDLVIVEAL
jgi:prepilin-type N-terminal cleavage/methylation domain-containing protein